MADFSFLSDTDDSAVEDLISQAQDLCVLEQVSAINCSGFTDSVLPTDLESRFRKLKSFPVTKHKSSSLKTNSSACDSKTQLNRSESISGEDSAIFSPSKQNPDGKIDLNPNSQSGSVDSSGFSNEERSFTPSKENPNGKKGLKAKSKHGYASSSSNSSVEDEEIWKSSKQKRGGKKGFNNSPLSSSNSFMNSPSPPKKTGCFWCSPKKDSQKKYKENGVGWGKSDEFLSDLGIFSSKEQQKIMKKAMKEEEKISREAEKIVKWAKQASARMIVSDIEDELSDDDGCTK